MTSLLIPRPPFAENWRARTAAECGPAKRLPLTPGTSATSWVMLGEVSGANRRPAAHHSPEMNSLVPEGVSSATCTVSLTAPTLSATSRRTSAPWWDQAGMLLLEPLRFNRQRMLPGGICTRTYSPVRLRLSQLLLIDVGQRSRRFAPARRAILDDSADGGRAGLSCRPRNQVRCQSIGSSLRANLLPRLSTVHRISGSNGHVVDGAASPGEGRHLSSCC